MVSIKEATIQDPSGAQLLTVIANGELTTKCPCAIYRGDEGKYYAIKCAVDAASEMSRIAVAVDTIADGESGLVQLDGYMQFASGGTAGKGVTAISNAGVITAATDPSATNIDDGVIKGWCQAAGYMYKTV